VATDNIQPGSGSRLAIAMLALLVTLISACASTPRPTPPEAGAPLAQPWGSVPLQATAGEIDQEITDSFIKSLQTRRDEMRRAGVTGKIPYRALTLSGGGSRGAYGAGVLSGWTARGDRPQFDVVTGISTGALTATHAFLGPEFDDGLKIYKNISDDDVFRKLSARRCCRSLPRRHLISLPPNTAGAADYLSVRPTSMPMCSRFGTWV